ncbi:MAG: TolC family protein [Vicinamibacterales bacterium]
MTARTLYGGQTPVPIVAVLALLHATAAAAQTPTRLTLDEAQARAVAESHRVGEARARHGGAEATVVVRGKADLPTLSALGGYTRTNHIDEFGVPQPDGRLRVIYPDIPDNFRTRLELQWPIYTSGRTAALERAARAEAAASGADLAAVQLDLRHEAARAYWALVTARDTVRVLEAALAAADRSLTDVRNRVDAGLLPPNDVSRSEAQRARQELLLIEARGRVESVTIDLDRLLGLPDGTVIEPADGLENPPPPSRDAQTLVGEALGRRPELSAIAGRTLAAEERIAAIATARKPIVSVGGGVDWANPNPRIFPRQDTWQESWDVSVNVSWQLFDWGRNAAERAEAQFAVTALGERRAETEQQIRADVRRQVLDLSTTEAALAPARLAVTAAQEAQRVVADRFEAGVATTLDVLDAQLAVLQAELDRTRVLADLRLAQARLARILGR